MELDSKLLPEIDLQTETVLPIHPNTVCRPLENISVKQEPYFNMAGYGTSPSENTEHVGDIANTVDVKPKVIDDSHPEIYAGHNHGLCSNGNCADTDIPHDTHVDLVKSEPKDELLETTDHSEFIIEIDTCKDEYYETHGYPNNPIDVNLGLGESGVKQESGEDCATKDDMCATHIHTKHSRWTLRTPVNTKPCTVALSDIRYTYPDIVARGYVHVHVREPTNSSHTYSTSYVTGSVLQPPKQKPYICSVSGVGFAHKWNMNTHMMIHARKKPHRCSVCEVSFREKGSLTRHIRTHTWEKPYKCTICGIGFIQKGGLNTHVSIHNGGKPHICSVCEVSFTDKSNLTRRMRTHTGAKPYNCSVCGVGYAQRWYLKIHMGIHPGEKPHKCSICGISFAIKCNLTRHMRTHTVEKLHVCSVCGDEFIHKQQLRRHTRTHTGEKPHTCLVCAVSFSQKSGLASHMRTHTGAKPYQCTICGVDFSQKYMLMAHHRIHTVEKPYK